MALSVVAIGESLVHYFGVIPSYPGLDRTVQMHQFSMQCGGAAATSAATLANLGVAVAYVGKVSDDHFGEVISGSLADIGVNLRGLVHRPGRIGAFTFIAIEEAQGRRTAFQSDGDLPPLNVEEVDLTLLDGARYLLLDGTEPAAQIAAAQFAKGSNCGVVLRLSGRRPGTTELIALCDYLVVSEHFVSELVPTGELERGLRSLKDHGCRAVVITLGEEGCIGLGPDDQLVRVPGHEVDVVDTTGASEIFVGTLVHGLLEGWPFSLTLRIANRAAAHACTALGALAALPRSEEIRAYRKESES
ncbi:MAG: hypothetical protein KC609_16670 [Myxococcales bacterium]|nr:hypothetical protein [Myxococcales bacterium]